MDALPFNLEHDYDDVCNWWNRYFCPVIPKDCLSDIGVMVFNDQEKVCAGWLYTTNSKICLIENFIGNPDTPKEIRAYGLDLLFEELIYLAKKRDNKYIISSSQHSKLIERATEKFNFKEIKNYKVFSKEIK